MNNQPVAPGAVRSRSRLVVPEFLKVPVQSIGGIVGVVILALFCIVAIIAPALTSDDPFQIYYLTDGSVARLVPPSEFKPLGTDFYGRDIFAQLLHGTRTAIVISVISALCMVAIGTNVGLLSAYYGGGTDRTLMRITDLAFAVPFLPFAVILVALLQPSIWNIIFTISCLMWRSTARIIRSQALSIKERTFIKASRVAGASDLRIIYLHIFPNVLPLTLLYVVFGVSWAVLSEASLAFLGFGDPDLASWGQMLNHAYASASIRSAWWWTVPPGLCITLFVMAVFLVGREYERYTNPKLR